ncbi:hypothetical protein BU23DRAFT_456653 [Bimuria novae-zelandiae CBS 107.79]|uniref:Zn(2)-C6 fungal-type domain-containing protein n=1 Tax=Bimuria novae-zelandiae CBS 107.79 TaxID=1447943 RepID=A0A6A5VGX3_9PLEO|nr:hypothetical protein BU23DRAFT_456653 [Bimuria novae-zelandiae CBS 107.79]
MSDTQPQHRYVPPSRRRDKPILSCSLCRRRKLKCDRQQPCKTCVDRGLPLSCTYSRNVSTSSSFSASDPSVNVHDRIDQLEKLVTSLMGAKNGGDPERKNTGPSIPSPLRMDLNDGSADTEAPKTPAHMTLETDETQYTDSGHWMSILDSIAELKGELDQIASDPPQPRRPDEDVGPELLLGLRSHVTRQDIIAGLPCKPEADQILERYWLFVDIAPTIMHKPKFIREYNEFWKNPDETPIMWIGLLYGVFAISTRLQSLIEEHDAGILDPSQQTFSQARQDLFRQKVAQCLILGNYTKCPPFTMEAFLTYFVIEYLRSRDTQNGIWMLVGMLVRTAFRMGLHREPSKLTNNDLSPFECEMRRRMWCMVLRLDLISSGQVGLPRMIHPAMTDTLEPRNLIDEDLREDLTELPPSRPDLEFTPMLYTIVRNRFLAVFARVVDLVSASEQPTYREVLELDEGLRRTYDNVPDIFKNANLKDFNPYAQGSMSMLILGLTYLKSLEMLHRPFLFLARDDPRYEYSRTSCIDAALEILDIQHMLELRSLDNRNLCQAPWWTSSWRLSSLINHDFLLATTILVLDLDQDLVKPIQASDVPRERFKSGQPTRAEIIHALARVYELWTPLVSSSREVRKVTVAVKYVLGKAGASGFTPNGKNFPLPIIWY